MTVSPVFAADSAAFKQCQQIKPQGKFGPMKQKKNCFRDVARALQDQSGDSVQSVAPAEPSGGEVAQLNARIAESESQVATLTTTNAQLQEQLMAVSAAAEPLNSKVATLESQLSEANEELNQVQQITRKASQCELMFTESNFSKNEMIRWQSCRRICGPGDSQH
jgi:chromosome segregation ATPase